MTAKILSMIWETVISSSVLIFFLLLIRRLFFGRIHPKWQYAVWSVVLIRLLIPVSMESVFSIMNTVRPVTRQVESFLQTDAASMLPADPNNPVAKPLQETEESSNPIGDIMEGRTGQASKTKDGDFVSLPQIIILVWIFGMISTLIYMIMINLRFTSRIRKDPIVPLPGREAVDSMLRLRKKLPVYMEDRISSPCLVGVFHPYIVITPKAAETRDGLRYVLLHELCHYKHRDHWIALLRNAVCIVYWFNPMVWIAAAASKKDCELACDARVLGYLSEEEGIAYGETLLSFIRKRPARSDVLQTSTAMTADKKALKERIQMIAKRPKTLGITAICAVILTLSAVLIACTGTPGNDSRNTVNSIAPSQSPSPIPSATAPVPEQDAPADAHTDAPAAHTEAPTKEESELSTRLLENLNKQEDELTREAYKWNPDGFSVETIYDGTFSDSGKPEKLAIIKVVDPPHVAGLDAHIAAVYDGETLESISAKYFATDQFRYHIYEDADGRGYFGCTGFSMSTGLFDYSFGLYEMGNPWKQISPYSFEQDENAYIFPDEQGVVHVYHDLLPHPRPRRRLVMLAEPDYTLAFDKTDHSMIRTYVPDEEKQAHYYDIDYEFSLMFPASWHNKFAIHIKDYPEIEESPEDDGNVYFLYTPDGKNDTESFPLFSLRCIKTEDINDSCTVLKKMQYPTGDFAMVLYREDKEPEDAALHAEFNKLREDLPTIAESVSEKTLFLP